MLDKNKTPKIKGIKHIVVHWTAGGHKANSVDKKSYHFLIEGDGNIVYGNNSVSDNIPPLRAGKYAAHTKNLNSYTIGVSMCAMKDAQESPINFGSAPLTITQWNKMIEVVAELATIYEIDVSNKTVLTHAEVQPNLGIKQNNKWDITVLPWDSTTRGYKAVGNKLRSEVIAKMNRTNRTEQISDQKDRDLSPPKIKTPDYSIKEVQQALRDYGIYVDVDGIWGRQTSTGVKIFQKLSQLPQTGMIDAVTLNKLLG